MVRLGEYQSTSSAGFIYGCIFASVLIVFSIVFLKWKGLKGNDKFAFVEDKVDPRILLAVRCVCLAWTIPALVLAIIEREPEVRSFEPTYFTRWNWYLIMIYFMVGIIASSLRVCRPESVPKLIQASTGALASFGGNPEEVATELDGEASFFVRGTFYKLQMIGEIAFPTSLVVAGLAWGYLAPTAEPSAAEAGWYDFHSIAMHATNVLILAVDFFLAGYLVNPWHFVLCLLWPALYVLAHLILNTQYGFVAYGFLKTDSTSYIFWTLGLAVGMVGLFFVIFGFSKLKEKFCCVGKRVSEGNTKV